MFDELEKELGNIVSAFDLQEMVKRLVKYLVEGAAVAAAVYYIPKRSLDWEEIVTIAITAAATFCVLDVVSPSIAGAARQGTGFGIGANLAGFPK
tara:strand:- start:1665 stop:1949 length:285 start_codon:yes stop_codon:yes gene_type:complete